ncbi:unnamed protein product [Calicophoron daubneyi]|uniref:Uncharacterized protein n=1 Tax=Calicophoron daubneyi TaxID=300641 RepID=A0AAV2TR84_CALDB
MNSFKTVLFVFCVALVSSHTAVDATDYIIPQACQASQAFDLNGGRMNGSTFTYNNHQNLSVRFAFYLPQQNPNATLSFYTDNKTEETNRSFWEMVSRSSIRFSFTGNWSERDAGFASYDSVDGPEDCDNRTATNLRVRGYYEVPKVLGKNQFIWAREDCGVRITLYGVYPGGTGRCSTTLEFDGKENISTMQFVAPVTTTNGPISFRIYSNCSSADVLLNYQENCRSITTKSTEQSAAPTSSTTTKSTEQSAAPTSSTTTKSTEQSAAPTSSTTTKSTEQSAAPTSSTTTTASESTDSTSQSSGSQVVVNAQSITFALILSMFQWQ